MQPGHNASGCSKAYFEIPATNKRLNTPSLRTTQAHKTKIKQLTGILRSYRVYHRYLGIGLGVFLIISSFTGFLLGWKKDIDLLQPPTQKGITTDLRQWISLAEMATLAQAALDSAQQLPNTPIDRLEARPDKGIVKVLFAEGYWEVQLEASTGNVLSVARRHSDWIEQLHDGSIISDGFKLVSMNVLGLGLMALAISGFILWLFPRKVRQLKK